MEKTRKINKNYAAYLFDADGTLFDTTELIYQCYRYSLGHLKPELLETLSRNDIIRTVGLPLRTQMELYLSKMSDEEFARVAKLHQDYQYRIFKQYLTVFPGIVQGLTCLKQRGARLAVVTSRRLDSLEHYLKYTGIYGLFDVLITPDDSVRHKPDPQPVEVCLSRLEVSPQEALFIGDSRFDILAGNRAGVDTALVGWSRIPPEQEEASPTYFLVEMRDLCVAQED